MITVIVSLALCLIFGGVIYYINKQKMEALNRWRKWRLIAEQKDTDLLTYKKILNEYRDNYRKVQKLNHQLISKIQGGINEIT